MASWRGHLTFSTGLGVAFTALSWWQFHVDWPVAAVGGLLTALGGLLPDLDSDSGVPMRELTHLSATVVPIILLRRIASFGLSPEQALLAVAGCYLFVRYVLTAIFNKVTVHRGMFHSVPAMLIAGLLVFLGLDHPTLESRLFFSVGVMLGFLSHLVLDEICSVDINGVVPQLKSSAGTAVKFWSPSLPATAFTYIILAGLGYEAYRETQGMESVKWPTAVASGTPDKTGPASPTALPPETKKTLGFPERPMFKGRLFERSKDGKKSEGMTLSIPGFNN
ncbi:MAG: metal-dependent hydrolase [Gemmataceae bacterium]|nr:metal-dependent hydrolase [Gemmataceae bacterium]